MVKRATTKGALANTGSSRNENIIRWLIDLSNENPTLSWEIGRGTVVNDEKLEVRIDVQGIFTDGAHGERWFNIQLQWRDATLVTVMVQKRAVSNNYIRTRSICERLKKAMMMSIETQTMFVGNTQWLMKHDDSSGRQPWKQQRLSPNQAVLSSFPGRPEEIPRENIRLAGEVRDQALEGANPRRKSVGYLTSLVIIVADFTKLPSPPNEE